MPIDGCVYLKASDGTLVPLTRVGPQGPKGDPGIPVAPTAADEGKVLVARSQSAVWESAPSGGGTGGGITQAEADARYLRLTGGTVQTSVHTIYGHSLLLDINEDEGLMLGTMGPDPDIEFSGIIWTPPMIPGRNGSRVNLASEFPIMLQAPNGTLDSELVNKGYVDAKLPQTVAPVTLNGTWFRDLGDGHAPLRACRTGRSVHVSGVIINHNAAEFPALTAMGSLPAGFIPDAVYPTWGVGEANTHYRINARPDGQLWTHFAVTVPPNAWMALDFTYLVSN